MTTLKIPGVGPETPTVTNERGGKQSASPYAFYLTDPIAMFKLAEVLAQGAEKYERDNWRKIDTEAHLNHALQHIYAYMAKDDQDNHLEHAFCRLMMAVATQEEEKPEPKVMCYKELKKGQLFYFENNVKNEGNLKLKLDSGYSLKRYPSSWFIPIDEEPLYHESTYQQTRRTIHDRVIVVNDDSEV